MMEYNQSLKVYRDLENVTQSAFDEGVKTSERKLVSTEKKIKLAIKQREQERKMKEDALKKQEEAIVLLYKNNVPLEKIAGSLHLTLIEVKRIVEK